MDKPQHRMILAIDSNNGITFAGPYATTEAASAVADRMFTSAPRHWRTIEVWDMNTPEQIEQTLARIAEQQLERDHEIARNVHKVPPLRM